MKEILLVGNGPSVLDSERGQEIDEFPCVARFNKFVVKGYEKYVGTKCNVWVTGNRHPRWQKRYDYDEVIYICQRKSQKFDLFKTELPRAELIPRWVWDEVRQKAGKGVHPSSGLLAAYYFSKSYDKVYIYGYDYFYSSRHYYSDISLSTRHIPEKEKMVMDELKETGIVKEFAA